MNHQNTDCSSEKKSLEFQTPKIRYLYNFLCDFLDLDFISTDKNEKTIESCINDHFDKKEIVVFCGNLYDRNGIEGLFRSKIQQKIVIDLYKSERAKLTLSDADEIPIQLSTQICLSDSGLGLCEIKVELPDAQEVDLPTIHNLLALVKEAGNHDKEIYLSYDKISSKIIPYDIFINAIYDLFHAFSDKKGPVNIEWESINKNLNSGKEIHQYNVELLDCQVAQFSKNHKKKGFLEFIEYQKPYVVTELTLPGPLYQEIFLDENPKMDAKGAIEKRKKYGKELASILLREIKPQNIKYIDPTFPAWDDLGLAGIANTTNLNLNSMLYFSLHFRSALIIRNGAASKNDDPGPLVIPGILSMIDSIRSRWYSLLILNGLLDVLLRELRKNKGYSLKLTKDILRRRMKLGDVLEDPLLYQWGGGSAPEAYAVARRTFSIERLEKAALQKFTLLDRTMEDMGKAYELETFFPENNHSTVLQKIKHLWK